MMTYAILTAVALVCGVIGAMGYSHFFGPKPGEPSSSQSQTAIEQGIQLDQDQAPGPAQSRPARQAQTFAPRAAIESSQRSGAT